VIEAEFAFVRVTRSMRQGKPGAAAWAVFRRGTGEEATLKVFLTNAPESLGKHELARVNGMRWPIETAFEEVKGEVGMDHYEVRTWRGWHHHMTQTLLAYHFLVRMRLKYKKSPSADLAAGEAAGDDSVGRSAHARTSHRNRLVSAAAELCGLPNHIEITPKSGTEDVEGGVNPWKSRCSTRVLPVSPTDS
jgi:hypothetical protein